MDLRVPVLLALLLAGAACAPAFSQQRNEPWDLGGSLALATNYVNRGISQSDGHGAIQGEVVLQHETSIYGSIWASTVDFADGHEARVEVNYIVGFERVLAETAVGVSAAYIHYPSASSDLEYDLWEFSATAMRPLGPVNVGAQAIYSPAHAGNSRKALYLRLDVMRELTESLSLGVHVGRQAIEREELGGPDYVDWGVSLGWSRGRFSGALNFTDTNTDFCEEICEAGVHATAAVDF